MAGRRYVEGPRHVRLRQSTGAFHWQGKQRSSPRKGISLPQDLFGTVLPNETRLSATRRATKSGRQSFRCKCMMKAAEAPPEPRTGSPFARDCIEWYGNVQSNKRPGFRRATIVQRRVHSPLLSMRAAAPASGGARGKAARETYGKCINEHRARAWIQRTKLSARPPLGVAFFYGHFSNASIWPEEKCSAGLPAVPSISILLKPGWSL